MRISQGEISETTYWLEIIEELGWVESKLLDTLLKESNELLAIFTSIITKLKNKK